MSPELDTDGSTNPDFDLLKISSSLEMDSLNLFFSKRVIYKIKAFSAEPITPGSENFSF